MSKIQKLRPREPEWSASGLRPVMHVWPHIALGTGLLGPCKGRRLRGCGLLSHLASGPATGPWPSRHPSRALAQQKTICPTHSRPGSGLPGKPAGSAHSSLPSYPSAPSIPSP